MLTRYHRCACYDAALSEVARATIVLLLYVYYARRYDALYATTSRQARHDYGVLRYIIDAASASGKKSVHRQVRMI